METVQHEVDPQLRFLNVDWNDLSGYPRSFYLLRRGSDIPHRYPLPKPFRTVQELVVRHLVKTKQEDILPILALVNRDWCHGVRMSRFHDLDLLPEVNTPEFADIFRNPDVCRCVRSLLIDGCLYDEDVEMVVDGHADHDWLNEILPVLKDICTYAPIEDLRLMSLSWGDIRVEIRAALRSLTTVRALMIHEVDFWNSNQFLMTLNAYPRLEHLQIWHADFHALNHLPSQLQSTEPLLLTEVMLGCSYTALTLEWLLGQRTMLTIEELHVDVKDIYRDDARLARVVKKVSPYVKRFDYLEWPSAGSCEGCIAGGERRPDPAWIPPRVVRRTATIDSLPEVAGEASGSIQQDDDGITDSFSEDPDEVISLDNQSQRAASVPLRQRIQRKAVSIGQLLLVREFVPIAAKLSLPDDEGRQAIEDRNDEFYNPPFATNREIAYYTFADELTNRIPTPMLTGIEATIHWTSNYSFLALKLLCNLTFDGRWFFQFHLTINFDTNELYKNAPWRSIDGLLSRTSTEIPDDDAMDVDSNSGSSSGEEADPDVDPDEAVDAEEDEDLQDEDGESMGSEDGPRVRHHLLVYFCVKGWNLKRGHKAKSNDLYRRLPRTVEEGRFILEVKNYNPHLSRDGKPYGLSLEERY